MRNKALFWDRDGVLNKAYIVEGKSYPPKTLEEFQLLPGVVEGLEKAKELGFLNIVITNQPDISSGKSSRKFVDDCHKKLLELAPIDDIYVCPHTNDDCCSCRKPKPGMIIEAKKKWNIDLKKSFLIGDRWRDIEAGQAVNCSCFFLNYNYNEPQPREPFLEICSVRKAVELIKEREKNGATTRHFES